MTKNVLKNTEPTLRTETMQWVNKQGNSETSGIVKSTTSFFTSGPGEHRVMKGILGVICGLLAGGVLFLLLVYSYGFTFLEAGVASGVSAFILCILFAVSTRARCTGMVAVPSVATGRGRAALLSLVAALLLQGPVINITYNMQQVATSLACGTELALNQSRELQEALEKPIRAIQEQIKENVEEFKAVNSVIQDSFDTIAGGVQTVEDAIRPAQEVLQKAVAACTARFNAAGDSCEREVNKVKSDCERSINVAVNGAKTAVDKVKNFGKGAVDKVKDFFGGIGKRDVLGQRVGTTFLDSTDGVRSVRVKRQSEVCGAFSGSVLCAPVTVTGHVCHAPQVAGFAAGAVLDASRGLIKTIQDQLRYDIIQEAPISGSADSSKTADDIIQAVKDELRRKTETVRRVSSITSRLLSAFLFLFALQSILYVRSYLIKDRHDNVYITRAFTTRDKERQAVGEDAVLPLRKEEKSQYIETRSILLSPIERRELVKSLIAFLLHFLVTVSICLLDYALFWILELVRRNGEVTLTVVGESTVLLKVVGEGLFAKFIRVFVDGFSQKSAYNSTVDTTICLPSPKSTPQSKIFVFSAIYMAILILVIFQAYAQRMRHFIAACFYPEREAERVEYLYNRILHKRTKLKGKKKERYEDERRLKAREEKYRILPKWCPSIRKRDKCLPCCKRWV